MKDKTYLEGLDGLAYGDTEGSVFDADDWSLYDWSMMLDTYPDLSQLVAVASQAGVDGREAFFALSGHEVTGEGPIADAWKAMLSSPAWKRAKEQARTRMNKATILTTLLQKMGRRALDDGLSDDERHNAEVAGTEEYDDLDLLGDDFDLDDLVQATQEAAIVSGVPTSEELQDAEATAVLVEMMAGNAVGAANKIPQVVLDDAMLLASRIDFSTFKDLFGKTARIVRGASRKAETARGEMVGYKNDTWSDKVISTDMLAVAQGEMEAMVRLAEGTLQTRKFEGEEMQGKGPVVILRDETGSMQTSIPKQHAPALSLEVALAHAFNKDGRDLITIAWATPSTGTRQYTWGGETVLYTKYNEKTISKSGLESHLRGFLNGYSTKLEQGLVQALDAVDQYVPGADILIITDGYLHDSDVLANSPALKTKLERFWEESGRIWVIILGKLDEQEWREALPIADGFVAMEKIQSGDALEEMIASMADRSDPSSLSRRFVA